MISYSHLVRIFGLVFDSTFTEYKFTLREKIIGAKLSSMGFTHNYSEKVLDKGRDWCKLQINDLQFCVPNNVFKPGELSYIYNEVFSYSKYNPHAYEIGKIKLNKGDVVIDAGACEGFFAKYAIDRGAEKVYLFEPLEILQDGLRRTFSQQIKTGQIEIIPKALSSKSGICNFSQENEYICEAKVDQKGNQKVECITLDEFVENQKVQKLNFIKMDIEDNEVEAIQGGLKAIKQFSPQLSIAVYHSYENARLIESLLTKNLPKYRVYFGGCYMWETPYRPFMLYAHLA